MFSPKTERLNKLAIKYPDRIQELEKIFDKSTAIYIDFANVVRWQDKLKWHFDLKRLKQLFDSFNTIKITKFYYGTIEGEVKSEDFVRDVRRYGYHVITKPVKIVNFPINIASIPTTSPDIIKQFIRPPLLRKLNIETIEFINARLKELNKQGIMYLEDKKCNFDVEMGSDMLIDCATDNIDNFILWTGDSDFTDPLERLLRIRKKCFIFSTVRRVSRELNELKQKGLSIFELQKIKNFICWKREMT